MALPFRVDSQHVVVTGASSGIGAALARQLHARGARVTLVARRRALLEALSRELGDRCAWLECDLARHPTGWIAEAERGQGPINVLVNNAGIQAAGAFAGSDRAVGSRLMDVDLLAPLALTREVLPGLLERGHGAIVNVSSVAAWVAPAGMARYASAKAGLAAFSECLRSELAGTGVQVLTVYPGPIDNGSVQETHALYGEATAARLPGATAAELAVEMVSALERGRGRLIYPRFYALARWFPTLARWLVDRGTPPLRPLPAR
jgi:short-subunit dehydrogenase